MTQLEQLYQDLIRWGKIHKEHLGYFQEFEVKWSIDPIQNQYRYIIKILEADEENELCRAWGDSVDEAIEAVYHCIPQGFEYWNWPSEFPVKTTDSGSNKS